MTQWERPLIKTDTHIKAIDFAKSNGLRVWRVYEKAIDEMIKGGGK